ncbi:hypothetical protein HMPREF1230_0500 [Streptococcus pyogenes GA19681]|nr:hypothetical protein HMPREF1230_0500 [Streptococcus pyogenes GA19681]
MDTLIAGITSITISQIVMMVIGALLMYLGIKKNTNQLYLCQWGLEQSL